MVCAQPGTSVDDRLFQRRHLDRVGWIPRASFCAGSRRFASRPAPFRGAADGGVHGHGSAGRIWVEIRIGATSPGFVGRALVLGLQFSQRPHPEHDRLCCRIRAVCFKNLATAPWLGHGGCRGRRSLDNRGCTVAPCHRRTLADRCTGFPGVGACHPAFFQRSV